MKKTDFYTGSTRREGRPRGRFMAVADFVMLLLTLFFALSLCGAYLARYIHPSDAWVFSFAALVAPVLYILNTLTLLYWILRWRWIYVIIPAAAILLGVGNITLFFNPVFGKRHAEGNKKTDVVISFNVMGFLREDDEGKVASSLDSVVRFIRSNNPQIVCLQEFQSTSAVQKEMIDSLFGMNYNVVNYSIKNANGGGWGTAVYSNFPIISSGSMNFDNSKNSSVWADVAAGGDTLRIFSNHLQTTSVNNLERDYISSQEFVQHTPDREERVRGILSKLKRNYLIRAEQADTLAPVIYNSPHKVIVCGDFNDTPMSYVYFKMRGGLSDSFVKKGQGINSNTFKGLFNIFRIDYVLHSPEIKPVSYRTPFIENSDHKPVVVEFEKL